MAIAITSEELLGFWFNMIYEPSLYVLDLWLSISILSKSSQLWFITIM